MNAPTGRRVVWWAAAGLVVCFVLSLRFTAALAIEWDSDPRFRLQPSEAAPWFSWYYLMWAALTPAIFASARRLPVTRERWGVPIALHAAASVVVSAVAPTLACFLFSAFWRGLPWAELIGPMRSYWAEVAASRAISDPLTYGVILAAA